MAAKKAAEKAEWDDGQSYIRESTVVKDPYTLRVYDGIYVFDEIEFRYHATQQGSGKYTGRGVVSALAPTGEVLQMQGKARCEKEAKLADRVNNDEAQRKKKALNIRAEFYTTGPFCEEAIKEKVAETAQKLYGKNAPLMMRQLGHKLRPDTITPRAAVVLYVDAFLADMYGDASDNTRENYKSRITTGFKKFPRIPMKDIKPSAVDKITKQQKTSVTDYNRLRRFWDYCLDHGHCGGDNPFSSQRKRKKSVEARQADGETPGVLSLEQQDAVFQELCKGTVTGSDCAIALSLWGGVGFSESCDFCWKEFTFSSDHEDVAIVSLRRDDTAGATHDYSRLLFPQAALILRMRYDNLISKYSKAKLMEMPVVSSKRDPTKNMKNDRFLGDLYGTLRRAGIPDCQLKKGKTSGTPSTAKTLLRNTYLNNIGYRLGLDGDEGTIRFLWGQALTGDITSDHYTSFTDPDAIRRIHAAQAVLQPLRKYGQTETSMQQENGCTEWTFWPDDTRQTVQVDMIIKLLPGESIAVRCEHGAETTLKSRELLESGKAKRKSGRRKKTPESTSSGENQADTDAPDEPATEETTLPEPNIAIQGTNKSVSRKKKKQAPEQTQGQLKLPGF